MRELAPRLMTAGAFLTFLLIPVWYRLPAAPPLFTTVYVTRFLIVLPIVFTIAIWLISGGRGLRPFAKAPMRGLWAVALLMLALWAFFSLQWAFMRELQPQVGFTAALQWGLSALFVVAVACAGVPARMIIAALVIGVLFDSVLTLFQVGRQAGLGLQIFGEFRFFEDMIGVSVIRAGDLTFVRPYGLLPHPNMLAGALVIGTLAAGAWIVSSAWWRRWIGVIAFAGGVLALLFTFSRAAWGGFAVGLIASMPFVMVTLIKARERLVWRPVIVTAALVILIGVGFFVAYRPFLLARAGQVEESVEMRSIADRIVYTDFALRSIAERPVLGVGIGNFPWRTSYYLVDTFYDLRGDNVHNIYLSVWAELGTVGLALYVTAMFTGVIASVRAIRSTQGDDRMARAVLLAIFIALAAIGLLDHYAYTLVQFQVVLWGSLAGAMGEHVHKGAS